MKGTELFQKQIESAMDDRALIDPQFMAAYSNKEKNIKDCVTYVLNQVSKAGINGFADQEVFDMAAEYYTTEKPDIGGKVSGSVVINRTVELTEEEKKKAKEKAFDELVRETKTKARKKPQAKKKAPPKKPETKKETKAKKEEPKEPTHPTLF